MEDIDLKLKLFGGRPIHAEGYGDITPLTIKDVIDVGYIEYMRLLNILTLEVKDFLQGIDDIDYSQFHVFDLILIYGGEEVEKMFESALTLFLKGEVITDKENLRLFVKKSEDSIFVVNKSNYSEIQEVIKWQNYINSFEEKKINSSFNPADEETRKLKEEMDAVAKRRDELKKKQQRNDGEDHDDELDFYDILSAISSKSYGVNELNVIDLTIYQVYRKFKRIEVIEQYDISIQSILAGARDVKLKHWSSKA